MLNRVEDTRMCRHRIHMQVVQQPGKHIVANQNSCKVQVYTRHQYGVRGNQIWSGVVYDGIDILWR